MRAHGQSTKKTLSPAIRMFSARTAKFKRVRTTTMEAWRVRVCLHAHGLDKATATIAGAQPRREARRETAGLRNRLHHAAADAFLDRTPHRLRQLLPVDANPLSRRWAKRRHLLQRPSTSPIDIPEWEQRPPYGVPAPWLRGGSAR